MNFLFRTFVFLGCLVVVALFSALLVPYFINWDDFTTEFEEQASRVVGQQVRVGGKTNLRLLPLPFLSFENLQIGRNSDGSPLMTVEKFSFNAELLPFLTGEVRIIEMAMLRPKVNLQIGEDGTVAWTQPTEKLVNPELINIEMLNVENGSVTVSGLLNKREISLENIQGNFNAKSILGPWRIDVDAVVDGIPANIKAATGTLQDDDTIRLKLDLNRRDQPYNLLLDGPVSLEEKALKWAGEFKVSPFSKTLIEAMDKPIEPLPVLASGVFNATPQKIDVSEYRLEMGNLNDPYTVTGNGVISLDDDILFAMQVDGRQIDVDQLDGANKGGDEKLTLESRLTTLFEVLKRVPIPAAKGEIDIVLPAIIVGDTFIRNVQAKISPTGGGWELKSFQSTLPGSTLLEASGRLGLKNGFGFSGDVLLASRQPSGFADWVSGNVDETFRRLKTFGLSATLTASSKQATLENLELRLDDAILKGKLQRLSAVKERTAILAELRGNRVNVRDLQALYSLTQNPEKSVPVDFNFKVKAEVFEAIIADQPFIAQNLDADLQSQNGVISINRLNAEDLFGTNVSTKGRIENVLSKPHGNMKMQLIAPDMSEAIGFAQKFLDENSYLDWLKANPNLTSDTRLHIELDTRALEAGAKGRLLVNGILGGSDVSLTFGYEGKLGEPQKLPLTLDGTASNSSVAKLMQQIGIHTLPTDLGGDIETGLKLGVTLSGVAEKGLDTSLLLSGEGLNVSASGKINPDGLQVKDGDFDITIGAENITPYLVLANLPIPGIGSAGELPFLSSLKLSKTGDDYKLSDLKGQMADNRFSGNLALMREQVARPRIVGDIELSYASLPLVAEAILGRSTTLGNSLGISEDITSSQDAIFGEPLFPGLDAGLVVKADQLNLGNGLTGKSSQFQLTMNDGELDINDLGFDILSGRFNGGFRLENTQGTVLANLNYTLLDVEAGKLLKEAGLPQFIEGKLLVNGTAETSGQTIASLISNLSGNGFLSMDGAEIKGINTNAFVDILFETSVDTYEITPENINELIERTLLNQSHQVAKLEVPFSINRGSLKARNVRYNIKGTALNSDVELDLNEQTLEAKTIIGFTPTKRDAVSGADPQVRLRWQGPIDELERRVETDLLEGYLSLRAFEISQRRLETLEAQVMEKQRLRSQIAYAFEKEKFKERERLEALRLEEERLLREAEEARRQAELEEQKRQAELEAQQRQVEAERLRKLEEERVLQNQREEQEELERKAAQEASRHSQNTENGEVLDPNIIQNIEEFLNTTN